MSQSPRIHPPEPEGVEVAVLDAPAHPAPPDLEIDPGSALDAVFTLPSRPVRVMLLVVGTVALAIGVVALVVPLLPSTPFLLVAAACYARASERLYRWLIAQPAIGRIIVEWRTSRTIDPAVRTNALVTVVVSFGASILLLDSLPIRVVLLVIGLLVLWIVARIPTSRPPA